MMRKIGLVLAVLVAIAGLVVFWLSPPAYSDVAAIKDPGQAPGNVISVERVAGHNRLMLSGLLMAANLPVKTKTLDGAELFRVKYWSEVNGVPAQASGLVALPFSALKGAAPRGTVIFFHGTSPHRINSPSAPSETEGLLPAAIFTGGGYALLAPDYIGLGQSREQQTYLHTGATVAAARDLIVASQHVTRALKLTYAPDVYLVGFSQGGHATAIVQRALEAKPVAGTRIKAAASVAGAFDLAAISLPYALKHKHTLYLSYLAHSYSVLYKQPLDSVIVPKYAAILPRVYDGDHNAEQILADLPADPKELFLPERLAEMESGKGNWFVDALVANSAFDWRPQAPLRLYYGDNDTDVSPEDSKNLFNKASAQGGNIRLVPVGPYAHTESAYLAVPMSRLWFDEMSSGSRGK